MVLQTVISLSIIILTVTHGLDGLLKRCKIRKTFFLLYMTVCFAVSLTPVYNINRYFSLHLLFILSLLSFAVLLSLRRKTLLAAKEITFIFFTAFIFILETICSLLLSSMEWFYYFKISVIILFCALYIDKPSDAAICAGFSVWLIQLLLVLRNLLLDAYLYFDMGSAETAKISVLCSLGAFLASFIALCIKERRKGRKETCEDMELSVPSEKK